MSDVIVIRGGNPLHGSVRLHGAKNAVLPLLMAATLTDEEATIVDCPDISDVRAMIKLLTSLGVEVSREGRNIRVSGRVQAREGDENSAKVMRSSMFMLGALLATTGEVHMPLPGGCDIGGRPLDIHIDALKKMGAEAQISGGVLHCKAKRLEGADIIFRYPSVGATENVLMCAALANGTSRIINCAREPEISSLACALKAMGARIYGEGSSVMTVEGVKALRGAKLTPCADRIVAGTLLAATAAAGGDIFVYGAEQRDLRAVADAFCGEHCKVGFDSAGVRVRSDGCVSARNITTAPFPLFPTDMQPQFMAASCYSDGVSVINETVFERRFSHARELAKMGADITLDGRRAIVRGSALLHAQLAGAHMRAQDLRGGAGLIVAALAAKGESVIEGARFIDRGYENIEETLRLLGADVERL